jgi:biopolymer transport protein ExbD
MQLQSKGVIGRGVSDNAEAVAKPQLTSLIDVMTILLVFLMKSFSVDGGLITVPEELTLATSTSQKPPVSALNIEVTPKRIMVDGEVVGELDKLEIQEDNLIPALLAKLEEAKLRRADLDLNKLMIQSDEGTDFKLLKKVMYTCAKAEFKNFALLVEGQ